MYWLKRIVFFVFISMCSLVLSELTAQVWIELNVGNRSGSGSGCQSTNFPVDIELRRQGYSTAIGVCGGTGWNTPCNCSGSMDCNVYFIGNSGYTYEVYAKLPSSSVWVNTGFTIYATVGNTDEGTGNFSDGACYYNIDFSYFITGGYTISGLSVDGVSSPTQRNYCVNGSTSTPITITVTPPANLSGYTPRRIIISRYYSSEKVYISLPAGQNTLTIYPQNFMLSNWWGNVDLEIGIETYSGCTGSTNTIVSKWSGYFSFYKPLPAFNVVLDRTSCAEDTVVLTVDPTVVSNRSNYAFRTMVTGNEAVAGISRFVYKKTVGNELKFTVNTADPSISANKGINYTVEIFDKSINSDEETPPADYLCAVKDTFYTKLKPSAANFTLYPVPIGSSSYHISRYNLSDGVLNVNLSNPLSNIAFPLTVYYHQNTPSANFTKSFTTKTTPLPLTSLGGTSVYTVYLTDKDGCRYPSTGTQSATISKPSQISFIEVGLNKAISCHPNNGVTDEIYHNDGSIYFDWSGGIPPYSVDINNVTVASGLTTGSYTSSNNLSSGYPAFRVSDNHGAEMSLNDLGITSNSLLDFSSENSTVLCNGDETAYSVSVTGNSSPSVSYTLFDRENNIIETTPDINQASYTFPTTISGNYDYSVRVISNNCIAQKLVVIEQPSPISFSSNVTNVARYGDNSGIIELNYSGGTSPFNYIIIDNYEAEISSGTINNQTTVPNLSAGIYTIESTDANNCEVQQRTDTIRQPQHTLVLSFTKKDVNCFGDNSGKIYPEATGGWGYYQYGINSVVDPDSVITGLLAQDTPYTLFVRDAMGVEETKDIIITQPEELITTIDTVYNLRCFNNHSGSVQLNIHGGVSPYRVSADTTAGWTAGDLLSNLDAGLNQTIYVQDFNNCLNELVTSISEPTQVVVTEDSIHAPQCHEYDGIIYTTSVGGTVASDFNYNWILVDSTKTISNQSGILQNIRSGKYMLTVSDDNDCEESISLRVDDIDGPQLDSLNVDSVSCSDYEDGQIHLFPGTTPAYNYYIEKDEDGSEQECTKDITGLSAGIYNLKILNQQKCITYEIIPVYEPEGIHIESVSNNPLCYNTEDGSITLTITGGNGENTIEWNNGDTTLFLDGIPAGLYQVNITDKKGCHYSSSFEIISPPIPLPGWDIKNAIICTGNEYTLYGGDFEGYEWQVHNTLLSEEPSITVSDSGTYVLRIIDSVGCEGVDTFHLIVSEHPLDALLLLPDSAAVGEEIGVVDVTWPAPDSIKWLYDKVVNIINSNEWSQRFSVDEEGLVYVTLNAYYQGCLSDSAKTIMIYYNENSLKKGIGNDPLILGCIPYPNPNNGQFTLEIELSKESDISVSVYHGIDGQIIEKQDYSGLNHYLLPYSLEGLTPGLYMILIRAGNEQQVMKVIVD